MSVIVSVPVPRVTATCPHCSHNNRIEGSAFIFTGRSHSPFLAQHKCKGKECGRVFQVSIIEGA